MGDRQLAARVDRRDGAWLIENLDPGDDDTPQELFTCSASLVRARETAVREAERLGFTGDAAWWNVEVSGRVRVWELVMEYAPEEEAIPL